MKTSFVALLFSLPLLADTTAIDISNPVIVYQNGIDAQFTPVITDTPNGFSVSLTYGFNQTETEADLELEEMFTLTQNTMVALNYSASGLLLGGACSHGACPGMSVGITGDAQIESVAPVYISGSATSSTPYLGQAQASGTNSGQWLLGPGTYSVFQYAEFTASDAGVSSLFEPTLDFTITDPPSAVPEPSSALRIVVAVLLACALLRAGHRSLTQARAGRAPLR